MTSKLGKILASTGLAVAAVSAATLALASISPVPGGKDAAPLHSEDSMPGAVSGAALFDEGYGPVCYDRDDVLGYFDRDRVTIGGEMVMLEAGFDQDFANTWRSETDLDSVKVSGVFAHIFPTDAGLQMVDVVEIGSDGCAISRTLLTEEEWNAILVSGRLARRRMPGVPACPVCSTASCEPASVLPPWFRKAGVSV